MYGRVNGRINALAEFVALRLNEVDAHTGDRNAGFVEGYLLSHGEEAGAVVPFGTADGSTARSLIEEARVCCQPGDPSGPAAAHTR